MRKLISATAAAILCASLSVFAGTAGAQSPPPTVKLLDAGSGPMQQLRLSFKAGTSVTSRLTSELRIKQRANGQTQTQNSPPVVITISTEVAEVAPDGSATINFSYDKAALADDGDLSPTQLEAVKKNLDAISGIKGTLVVAPNGSSSQSTFEIPDNVNDTVRALLDQLDDQAGQLSVPFPEEAVGVGARWEGTQQIEASGLDFEQVATYTLKKIDGDQLTLGVKVKQGADKQTIDTPQGTVNVVSVAGKGKGTSIAVLSEPLPVSSRLQLTVNQKLEAGGSTLDQTIRTKVRLERA